MVQSRTRRYRLWSVVACSVLVACSALGLIRLPSLPVAHAATAGKPVVMSFAIGWQMPNTPPWGAITQEDLFALQTTNGTALDTSFLDGVNVPAWTTAAHAHGVQAMITIGGSADQHWQNACTGTNRAGFVRNLITYMVGNGFDGVDLDIEDDLWASIGPPDSAMTACIEAISNAAKVVKTQAGNVPLVSADVITNWEGEWFAPSQSYVDQYNLMTYGDTLTTLASDVSDTISQGLPAAKLVIGLDVIDTPIPSASACGAQATYAAQHGLLGAFVWDESTDETTGYGCLNHVASALGDPTPTPTPTGTATPLPSPTSTATPNPCLP